VRKYSVVDGLEAGFPDQVGFLRLNTGEENNQQLIAEHHVVGHPAFVAINSENVVIQRLNGVQTEAALRGALLGIVGEES
jgi:hypothetical protein